MKEYYEKPYSLKFDILDDKTDQFLEKHNLPKLTHGEINNK